MLIFAGFLGDEASNDTGVIEIRNVDFQGFWNSEATSSEL